LLAAALLVGCKSVTPDRDPVGQGFPEVRAYSLAGDVVELPGEGPRILLVGYAHDAQFDADRWLYGLLQAKLEVPLLELPTIPGLFPRMLGNTINGAMKDGVPPDDWQEVATVFGGSASRLIELTGNERPQNIRVMLVDASGQVRWFTDHGFSAGKLMELQEAVRSLGGG